MATAVLGGGLQGCCTALALAEQGANVVLFERYDSLLSRTAVTNEGKIHLGYMYAADPTLQTARTMMEGALAFAPFFERHLGIAADQIKTSVRTNYVVHRDTQRDPDAVGAYLREVHRLITDASSGRERAYFGLDLARPLRRWSAAERNAAFDPEIALEVLETPEVAISPEDLARQLRSCVSNHPRIELRLGSQVRRADRAEGGIRITAETAQGRTSDDFRHVVNALWDGRLAIDHTMGLEPHRPWLHRLKYGISLTLPPGAEIPPSATIVSGPFGEVVTFPDRQLYLTWYPECLKGISAELSPPDWPAEPAEPERSAILKRTVSAISGFLPSLKPLSESIPDDARVKGGIIVAWGETDIYDPKSELHRRCDIGVASDGRYHSIDPGKLTMIPYFAQKCADRIVRS